MLTHSQTQSPRSGTSARVCTGGAAHPKKIAKPSTPSALQVYAQANLPHPAKISPSRVWTLGQEQLRHAVPLLVHLEATQNAAEINHTIPQIPITVKGPPRLFPPIVSALKQRVGRGGTSTTDFVILHHQAGNQTFLCLSTISRGYIIYY